MAADLLWAPSGPWVASGRRAEAADPVVAELEAAEDAARPAERYLRAHAAALRVAADALAGRPRRRGALHRPDGTHRDVWSVLAEVVPELAEWAEYFAALELKRRAVAAGAVAIVSEREADDLVRDARAFRAAAEVGRRRARRREAGEVAR